MALVETTNGKDHIYIAQGTYSDTLTTTVPNGTKVFVGHIASKVNRKHHQHRRSKKMPQLDSL